MSYSTDSLPTAHSSAAPVPSVQESTWANFGTFEKRIFVGDVIIALLEKVTSLQAFFKSESPSVTLINTNYNVFHLWNFALMLNLVPVDTLKVWLVQKNYFKQIFLSNIVLLIL